MKKNDIAFEESLSEDWSKDLDVVEVPIGERPIIFLTVVISMIGILVGARLAYLGVWKGSVYKARAEANLHYNKRISAPRGIITDRYNSVLADNRMVFRALLDPKEFLKHKEEQEKTLQAIDEVLGLNPDDVLLALREKKASLDDYTLPMILAPDLSQVQLLKLKTLGLSALIIENGYLRSYPYGPVFSTVLGYTSLATIQDLKEHDYLSNEDFVGRDGLEAYYDDELQGTPGKIIEYRNAKGEILSSEQKTEPKGPPAFRTTLDAGLQTYMVGRMEQALKMLGRTSGVAMAMNPKTGEVLAMASFPNYDNNVFTLSERKNERQDLLNSPLRPLFNRAVSGMYAPGSTIKPLVGVAALKEGVINTSRTIFSPGYLDIPNPYDPSKPTRYPDWRYQGNVNIYSAIAQSSNVYFYSVGGGSPEIRGLGITKLREWWQKFNLGNLTGIDLPGEKNGFLPSPEWKIKALKTPWLLGDTYNVSIGQGDLQVTPIQLLTYINTIANGGKLYSPRLKADSESKILGDLSEDLPEIKEIQKAMETTVTSPAGSAHIMANLPFRAAGKTGTAQVESKTQQNAFFVGFAPVEDPKISVLILVEHSKEGSLNTIPVAKDVMNWYYENRLK